MQCATAAEALTCLAHAAYATRQLPGLAAIAVAAFAVTVAVTIGIAGRPVGTLTVAATSAGHASTGHGKFNLRYAADAAGLAATAAT